LHAASRGKTWHLDMLHREAVSFCWTCSVDLAAAAPV